jgi:hypothetical protein
MSNPAFQSAFDESPYDDPGDSAAPKSDGLLQKVRATAPFSIPKAAKIRREGDTEDLLNGLIAECHFLMRELATPSACQTADALTRQQFLGSAMELAITGANVGKVVAKLRSAGLVIETHQRQVTENVCRAAPPPMDENG